MEYARRLTGMRPRKVKGVWVYPHSADVLAAARLHPIQHYIGRNRTTIAHTIAYRVILEECRGAEMRRGSPPHLYWWDQPLEPTKEEDNGDGGNPAVPWGTSLATSRNPQ